MFVHLHGYQAFRQGIRNNIACQKLEPRNWVCAKNVGPNTVRMSDFTLTYVWCWQSMNLEKSLKNLQINTCDVIEHIQEESTIDNKYVFVLILSCVARQPPIPSVSF